MGWFQRLMGHPSARRSKARRKYGLTPRQAALKAEKAARHVAELDLFYQGREAHYQRKAMAGFPISHERQAKTPRKTARQVRKYGAIRAVMKQGYGRGRR